MNFNPYFLNWKAFFMDFFTTCMNRLKPVLRVSKDQEVAAALGLSKTAFSERKKRGSFPDRELRSLAAKHPELGIDVDYVLTGTTEAESFRQRAALHEAAGWPPLQQAVVSLTADERELLALYRAASLTAKMQAVQALQGTTQGGRGNVSQHIAAPISGSVAGRDVNAHPPAKKSTRR